MTIYSLYVNWKGATDRWLDKATRYGTWTKHDQQWYDATKRINPFIGMYKDRYERETYINRHGLDYSDVRQPWNLPGGSDIGAVGSYFSRMLNFTSSNITKLYEDEEEDPKLEWMKKQYRADFRR